MVRAGELYNATDPVLSEDRLQARMLLNELNSSRDDEEEKKKSVLKKFLPGTGAGFWLQQLGEFDLNTSNWLKTPAQIRELGGAIFGDRRFGRVFIYHSCSIAARLSH